MNKKINIAIDGHASCGKSTLAKQLAKKLNYTYIDTGAMYRCVTLWALEHGLIKKDKINTEQLEKHLSDIKISFRHNSDTQKSITLLNEKNVENKIRSIEVANYVSLIAKLKFVREFLVKKQQELGRNKGIVMDGRDIGTIVFPDAEIKFFMTASPEIRAKRRYDELIAKGEAVSFEAILKNVKTRDHIDQTRKTTPLKQAEDAILIDNSNLTLIEQFNVAFDFILKKYPDN